MPADVTQDVLGRGHRHADVEGQGFGAAILTAMYDETVARLDRAAEKDADRALDLAVLRVWIRRTPGLGKQAGDRPLGQRVIDDDAEGAFLVVAQDEDHAVMETRVLDRRRGDQQLAGGGLDTRLRRGSWNCRDRQDRRGQQHQRRFRPDHRRLDP
jgi:hypothetical protein